MIDERMAMEMVSLLKRLKAFVKHVPMKEEDERWLELPSQFVVEIDDIIDKLPELPPIGPDDECKNDIIQKIIDEPITK